MMDLASTYDACHASLIQCLTTVGAGCPVLPDNPPTLHRLRNLVQVLVATAHTPEEPNANSLDLVQTLNILSTSKDLLATLRGAGAANRVSGEMDTALTDTIGTLVDSLGAASRKMRADRVRGLYVIIDPQVTNGREPLEVATAAVRGGAKMLQLRDKLRDKGEILPLAVQLQDLCRANDVDLIMNDHADLAALIGCAGLHVGQTDLPVAQARQVLTPTQVVGRSNHEMEELAQSQEMGADHVAFGAIYATGTKGVGRPPQGVDRMRQAKEMTRLPLVAIGGINAENVAPVVEAGADAICVTAAVGLAPDAEAAAARLVRAIREAGGRV